jgi:hypothetical protein
LIPGAPPWVFLEEHYQKKGRGVKRVGLAPDPYSMLCLEKSMEENRVLSTSAFFVKILTNAEKADSYTTFLY